MVDIANGISLRGGGIRIDPEPDPPIGQQSYTSPGTYTWVAPTGVKSVCVVCIGGGGNGGSYGGGSGGGLGWKNNITVVPGQSYTVVVGSVAGISYFINSTIVSGTGGYDGPGSGQAAAGGTYTGDGGGNGGSSPNVGFNNDGRLAGGGGAGGYSGAGGGGGAQFGASIGIGGAGAGGGAGGGTPPGCGGGVGIFGQSNDGVSGGGGGSGGTDGTSNGSQWGSVAYGGAYGGGGGMYSYSGGPRFSGFNGAVRIIWGNNPYGDFKRAFPSTNTQDI